MCKLYCTRALKTFAVVSAFLAASPASSSTPQESSCELAKRFLDNNSDAQKVLLDIFRLGDERQITSLEGFMSALPTDFSESVVVDVGLISDLYADHVVVLHSNNEGNFYVRIAYERIGQEYFGLQFYASDQLKTVLIQWPFLHEAKPLDC